MRMQERIKQIRKQLGLTQAEFGVALGLSPTSAASWEKKDAQEPSNLVKGLMRKTFGININWLETGEGEMFDPPADETDMAIVQKLVSDAEGNELILSIMKCWAELDPPQRKALTCFVDVVFDDYQRRKSEAAINKNQEIVDRGESDLPDSDQKQA